MRWVVLLAPTATHPCPPTEWQKAPPARLAATARPRMKGSPKALEAGANARLRNAEPCDVPAAHRRPAALVHARREREAAPLRRPRLLGLNLPRKHRALHGIRLEHLP